MSSCNPPTPPSAAMLSPGDLVTEREAAAILATSVQTLRNWRWQHKGPRVRKIGLRLVRYHRADLAAFVAGDVGKDAA
ncbi:MAG: helix-turn-helix transcriptional regulator [Rudaea sp.]